MAPPAVGVACVVGSRDSPPARPTWRRPELHPECLWKKVSNCALLRTARREPRVTPDREEPPEWGDDRARG